MKGAVGLEAPLLKDEGDTPFIPPLSGHGEVMPSVGALNILRLLFALNSLSSASWGHDFIYLLHMCMPNYLVMKTQALVRYTIDHGGFHHNFDYSQRLISA